MRRQTILMHRQTMLMHRQTMLMHRLTILMRSSAIKNATRAYFFATDTPEGFKGEATLLLRELAWFPL